MLQPIKHGFITFSRFIALVVRQFFANDGIYRASALSFTTILSLVPLMSVSLTVLSIFPEYASLKTPMQDFIFKNFVPTTGQVVQTYLENFALQASQLSVLGLIFLVVTAILLIVTIEQAMNQIWRVKVSRGGVQAFFLYWAVLTLAPLMMGLSLVITSYIVALPIFHKSIVNHATGYSTLLSWAPFLLSLVTFTLLYVGIPNRSVRLLHGFLGAFVAAVLFEVAKSGFAFYITQFDTYTMLYGAFAVVPLFIIWIYTVWTIILIGAEVAHAVSIRHEHRSHDKIDGFSHSIRWLGYLYEAYARGDVYSQKQLIDKDDCSYQEAPDDMLVALLDGKLIRVTAGGNYMLGCDLTKLSLAELFQRLPWKLPNVDELKQRPMYHRHLAAVLQELKSSQAVVLSRKAVMLYDRKEPKEMAPRDGLEPPT